MNFFCINSTSLTKSLRKDTKCFQTGLNTLTNELNKWEQMRVMQIEAGKSKPRILYIDYGLNAKMRYSSAHNPRDPMKKVTKVQERMTVLPSSPPEKNTRHCAHVGWIRIALWNLNVDLLKTYRIALWNLYVDLLITSAIASHCGSETFWEKYIIPQNPIPWHDSPL